MGQVVRSHLPCDDCGSSDALSVYDNGSTHCFSCGSSTRDSDAMESEATEVGEQSGGRPGALRSDLLTTGRYCDVPKRGLREETLRKFGYQLGEYKGSPCHIANYRDAEGRIVSQKVRGPDKSFTWVGSPKESTPMFGQHLWGSGGKSVVITEG